MNHSTSNNGTGATAAPTITAWVIKAPDGCLADWSLSNKRKKAILRFIGCGICPQDWKIFYRRGYRCVRVQITEVQE